MKALLLSFLLSCAPALPAQEAPARPTPPAGDQEISKPDAREHLAGIDGIRKDLDLLKERKEEIPAERLEALGPELDRFQQKVREAIGEDILKEVAAREKAEEDHRRISHAVSLLQVFRAALQIYYGEHGGKYPASLSELIPEYMSGVPALLLPDHERSDAVTNIGSKKYDRNYPKAVTDSGGWLYFSDPKSQNYGLLLLDCSHTGPEGLKFYEY